MDKASINQTAREIEIQLMAFKSYVKCEISNISQKRNLFMSVWATQNQMQSLEKNVQ